MQSMQTFVKVNRDALNAQGMSLTFAKQTCNAANTQQATFWMGEERERDTA